MRIVLVCRPLVHLIHLMLSLQISNQYQNIMKANQLSTIIFDYISIYIYIYKVIVEISYKDSFASASFTLANCRDHTLSLAFCAT